MRQPKWLLVLSFHVLLGCAYTDHVQLAPYVPTPMKVVNRVLELAEVKKGDVVYDLGSGDGRIVITAAKEYGARAVGFEIDHNLVQKSRASVKREGVEHLVEIREQDVMTADFSPASVVTIYLLPGSNMLLRPVLWRQLKPGARVVSNDYDMEDWTPEKVVKLRDAKGKEWKLHLWRIKERDSYRAPPLLD